MLELHTCKITKIHPTGHLDLKAFKGGRLFTKVNTLLTGVEQNFSVGDLCVVLTDNNQTLFIGTVNHPHSNSKNIKNNTDLMKDVTNLKAIIATDEIGNTSRITVSPTSGVLIDSGGTALSHYAKSGKITHSFEKMLSVSPGVFFEIDQIDEENTIKIKFKKDVNIDQVANEIVDEEDHTGSHVLEIKIFEDKVINFVHYKDGEELWNFEIDNDGVVTIEHGEDNEWVAKAKLTHEMIIDALDSTLNFRFVDAFGVPHQLRTDPLFGEENVQLRDALNEAFTDEAGTLLGYRKVVLK